MEITFFGESLNKYSNQVIQISSVFLQECDHKFQQIEQVRLNVERLFASMKLLMRCHNWEIGSCLRASSLLHHLLYDTSFPTANESKTNISLHLLPFQFVHTHVMFLRHCGQFFSQVCSLLDARRTRHFHHLQISFLFFKSANEILRPK